MIMTGRCEKNNKKNQNKVESGRMITSSQFLAFLVNHNLVLDLFEDKASSSKSKLLICNNLLSLFIRVSCIKIRKVYETCKLIHNHSFE